MGIIRIASSKKKINVIQEEMAVCYLSSLMLFYFASFDMVKSSSDPPNCVSARKGRKYVKCQKCKHKPMTHVQLINQKKTLRRVLGSVMWRMDCKGRPQENQRKTSKRSEVSMCTICVNNNGKFGDLWLVCNSFCWKASRKGESDATTEWNINSDVVFERKHNNLKE